MKTSSPPPQAPLPQQATIDPAAIARAQSDLNKNTAIMNFGLNAVNQKNPYGSLTYKQVGTWNDGTPRYEAETTLSPEEMNKQRQQWALDSSANQTALDQFGRVQGMLSSPFKLGNEAVESRLMDLGMKRLSPLFQRQQDALENKLSNMGFARGTDAWDREMALNQQGQNDAINQLLLTGRGQANQELMAERNQPLSELERLSTLGQVQQPNFINTPNTNVANTDLAGITANAANVATNQWKAQNDYNMNAWQQQQQNKNAMIGGLFGLAAAPLGGIGMGIGKRF